nr:oxygen-independent coproporphyrinogen III oxidase [candidate division Zixibacteria bacterium]
MSSHDFIEAAYGRVHKRVPIWIMRQAGRYLPQYQEIKKNHTFWEICRSPELIAEVTAQPVEILGMDAAILFSDILIPLEPLGLNVDFTEKGPRLHPTIVSPDDVDRLRLYDPAAELDYILKGIERTRKRLNGSVPLIGFCGSPFTMAYYAVEGKSSPADNEIKPFIFRYPRAAEKLLDLLAELIGQYLRAQIQAGVQAVQLFDSRGGILSQDDYARFSLPFIKRVFDICRTEGVPRIFYVNNSRPYLKQLADLDCEVVGVDWRTDLNEALDVLRSKTVQGNLDPHMLYAPPDELREQTLKILDKTRHTDRFIFNLGHGITPQTPVENVRLLVETVHAYRGNLAASGGNVSRLLLYKYDRPGPRYTSYPTAPEWTEEYSVSDYKADLETASNNPEPLSMYIHIPFCRSRCFYCGCNTVVSRDPERPEQYLNLVDCEISRVAGLLDRRNHLQQLHWGGGTPTYLAEQQIARLFESITKRFSTGSGAELAIEVDPRVTTTAQIDLLETLGFNRISFGVQDFTSRVQQAIGRGQTQAQTVALYDYCRKKGFNGINVDLIYGLPYQTVEDFSRTISQVIEMGVDRVAVYSFAFLPTVKTHQRKIEETSLPGADLKYDLFATAVELFLAAGYIQIGMDHFARPDDELARALADGTLHRNFMGYTPRKTTDMVGIGMSAISELSGSFAQNYSGLDSYTEVIRHDGLATYRGCRLSRDDHIRRWSILSLMCNFRLDYNELQNKFGVAFSDYFPIENNELSEFIDDGLLERDKSGIKITPRGRVFVRNIAMIFDAYLRQKNHDRKVQFSRTI